MKYYRIGFVGSGNLAWHLAQDLEKAGHFIPVVYSRNQDSALLLASQLYDTQVIETPDFSDFDLELVVIAVSDDAIEPVSRDLLVNEDTVVVHTSGGRPIEILDHLATNYGVFYILQTFTKEKAIDSASVNN